MSDREFLSHFIEEPLYLIKDDVKVPTIQAESLEVAQPIQAEEPAAPVLLKPLPTFGKNLKHCIILVNWGEQANSSEKELLIKILSSVKRSEDDVLIASSSNASAEQIDALLAEYNHKHLIDFGTSKLVEIAHAETYTPVQVGPKKYLKADALSEIAQDVEKKKALWKALQEMFL